MQIIRLIETTKRFVDIILEDLNLDQSMVCGLKDGHAAEELGILKAAQLMYTEANQGIDNLDSVLIMDNLIPIPNLNLLIHQVFVENLSMLTHLERILTIQLVYTILVTLGLLIEKQVMEFGPAVNQMKRTTKVVLKVLTNLLIILMRKLKSISLIEH
jgi:hypothetical protein